VVSEFLSSPWIPVSRSSSLNNTNYCDALLTRKKKYTRLREARRLLFLTRSVAVLADAQLSPFSSYHLLNCRRELYCTAYADKINELRSFLRGETIVYANESFFIQNLIIAATIDLNSRWRKFSGFVFPIESIIPRRAISHRSG